MQHLPFPVNCRIALKKDTLERWNAKKAEQGRDPTYDADDWWYVLGYEEAGSVEVDYKGMGYPCQMPLEKAKHYRVVVHLY